MKNDKSNSAKIAAVIAVSLSIVATLGLTSCAACTETASGATAVEKTAESADGSLVVAVQKTNTAPVYTLGFIDEFLKNAQDSHDQFDIVVMDGDPFPALDCPAVLGSTRNNERRQEREKDDQRSQIEACISRAQGKTEGVDVLGALALADRIHTGCASGMGTTVVAASGLSDSGALDLTGDGMLTVESDTISAYLKGYGYDLSHTERVVWYGFGDVAGEQEKLTPAIIKSLEATYKTSLEALGVGEVVFEDEPVASSAGDNSSQPSAKLIDIPEIAPIKVSVAEEIRLTCETLPFVAGTANLIDPDSAASVVAPFASAMAGDASLTCTVAGSTASYPWDESYAYELGLLRAKTVAGLLSNAGVEQSRISVVSYGDDAPGHVDDIDQSTGLQIPEKAQQNRWTSITLS